MDDVCVSSCIITFTFTTVDGREVGEPVELTSFCPDSDGTAVSRESSVQPNCFYNTGTFDPTHWYTFGWADESIKPVWYVDLAWHFPSPPLMFGSHL